MSEARQGLEEMRLALDQWLADFKQLRNQMVEDARRFAAERGRSAERLRQLTRRM